LTYDEALKEAKSPARFNNLKHKAMTTDNVAVVRRFFDEAASQQKLEVLDQIFAPEFDNHGFKDSMKGPEGIKNVLNEMRNAFPDMNVVVEECLPAGDNSVVTRGYLEGTHQKPYMGIEPRGEHVQIPFIDMWRFENGKATEYWVQMDMFGLQEQAKTAPIQMAA
jgi:predicted ester cyclase